MRLLLSSLVLLASIACATGPLDPLDPSLDTDLDPQCDQPAGGQLDAEQVLRFEGEDGSIAVLKRRFVEVGQGRSAIYAPMFFGVKTELGAACVLDEGALEYENTHHNWQDVAFADVDGVRYQLEMFVYPDERTTLSAEAAGSEALTPRDLQIVTAPDSP